MEADGCRTALLRKFLWLPKNKETESIWSKILSSSVKILAFPGWFFSLSLSLLSLTTHTCCQASNLHLLTWIHFRVQQDLTVMSPLLDDKVDRLPPILSRCLSSLEPAAVCFALSYRQALFLSLSKTCSLNKVKIFWFFNPCSYFLPLLRSRLMLLLPSLRLFFFFLLLCSLHYFYVFYTYFVFLTFSKTILCYS